MLAYSAVSASLTNPLPDCSELFPILSHPLPHNTSLVSWARPFTKPLCWRLILHCCNALLLNLVGNSYLRSTAVRKLNNKQRQVVMFLLLFKLSTQLAFVSFSFLSVFSLLPFSILSLLPFLIFPSISNIPSFSSDKFSVLLR